MYKEKNKRECNNNNCIVIDYNKNEKKMLSLIIAPLAVSIEYDRSIYIHIYFCSTSFNRHIGSKLVNAQRSIVQHMKVLFQYSRSTVYLSVITNTNSGLYFI